MQWVSSIFNTIVDKPMSLFLALAMFFGFMYWTQNSRIQELLKEAGELSAEIHGLRVEQQKMHEIIILKVRLAEKECECMH